MLPELISMDDYIDVEMLKSLDGHVVQGIEKVKRNDQELGHFRTVLRMNGAEPKYPGSRTIHLTEKPGPQDYYSVLTDFANYRLTPNALIFSGLMDFIYTLPFEVFGRAFIIVDEDGVGTPAHKDHNRSDWMPEFIWFRTNDRRRLYVCSDPAEKKYIDSYSAWFDTSNQYHGVEGVPGLTFSIRVDGRFSSLLRQALAASGAITHGTGRG